MNSGPARIRYLALLLIASIFLAGRSVRLIEVTAQAADLCAWQDESSPPANDWDGGTMGTCGFGDSGTLICYYASISVQSTQNCDTTRYCLDHESDCQGFCRDQGLIISEDYCPTTGDPGQFWCGCSTS